MAASEAATVADQYDPRARPRDEKGLFVRGDPNAKRSRSLRGNMNRVKHPWATFWRRRALRPQDRWILPLLQLYRDGLASDKGGPANIGEGELRMIELAQLARGCTLLVLAAARDGGGLVAERKGPDLAAALGRFMQVEASCLKTLGLARRARPVDLGTYVASRREDQAEPPSVG
jgi:hypothetical protein